MHFPEDDIVEIFPIPRGKFGNLFYVIYLVLGFSPQILNFTRNMNVNPQNYWAFGLCPSSGILVTKTHDISETVSVPARDGGRNLLNLVP
jgi:hypothetical protein